MRTAMKLPVLDTYTFPITLPSNNETITLRPFLVKEEKLLLLAQESKNYTEQVEAIAQVIRNCSTNQIEPKKSPYFDIEYALIQLRARSVGDVITPVYICHNIQPNQNDECGHKTPLKINLQDVKVNGLETQTLPHAVELTDRYTLHLRYPTVYTVHKLLAQTVNPDTTTTTDVLDATIDVFDTLHDKQTGVVYKFDEFEKKEKTNFLNSLTTQQYEKITDFIGEMPSVSLATEYTCERCGFVHKINLRGLADFLE